MNRLGSTAEAWEDTLDEGTREELAYLRSQPRLEPDDDPNDWLSQILQNLRRSPGERLDQWTGFANSVLRHLYRLRGYPHVDFRPRAVLQALTDHQVDFVLVGMGAAYVQGAPFPTYNTDFVAGSDPSNLDNADSALRSLESEPLAFDQRGPVERADLPGFARIQTNSGMVNKVDALPGVGGYERLMKRAELMDLGGDLGVWVAAIEDVIVSKQHMDRTHFDYPSADGVHLLMLEETLAAKKKFRSWWTT